MIRRPGKNYKELLRKDRTIYENLDAEAIEKLRKSDQKRKQTIPENLVDEVREKLCESDQKTTHTKKNYMKLQRKEWQ